MNLDLKELRRLINEELRISPQGKIFLREQSIERLSDCSIADWSDFTPKNWGTAGGAFSNAFYQRTPGDWIGFGSDSWYGALNKLAHKPGLPGTQIVRTYLGANRESRPKSGALLAKKIFDTVPVLDNCTVGGALKIIERDGGFDVKIQCPNTPMPPIYLRDLVYMIIDGGDLSYVKDHVTKALRASFELAKESSEDRQLASVDNNKSCIERVRDSGEILFLGNCPQEYTVYEIVDTHFDFAMIAVEAYIDELFAPISESISCWLTILQRVLNNYPIIFWALVNGMELLELVASFDIPNEDFEIIRDSNNIGSAAFCNFLIESIPDDILVTIRHTCLKIQQAFSGDLGDINTLVKKVQEVSDIDGTLQAYNAMSENDFDDIAGIIEDTYRSAI